MKKLKIERTAKRAKIKKFDNLTILVLACIILKKLNSPTKSQVIDFTASLELFLELNNVILTLIGSQKPRRANLQYINQSFCIEN